MEITVPQDPVVRALSYLTPYLDAVPQPEVPANWEWGPLLVVVTDTGGAGERDVVLDDARLTVEVSHQDSVIASETCRRIHGLLRAWQGQEPGVYWLRTLQRPTYTPDEQTRTPAYTTTVELSFRAGTLDATPLS